MQFSGLDFKIPAPRSGPKKSRAFKIPAERSGAGASKGHIAAPRKSFHRSVPAWSARRKMKSPPPEKMWSARRKVKSPPPENRFPVPRGAGASKGDNAGAPGKSSKCAKSPTGHPGALGKVPQSILQWMFSESISDAFHPGDFPISPRITRGRSTAAPCQPARPRWVKSTQVTSAV